MSKLIRSIAAFSIVLSMPVAAFAQGGQELAGGWTYVSAVTERDGTKSDIFGPAAKGALVFDTHGRYTITFISSGLPKFAANNRAAGTAEENKAVVTGSLAHFGTYTVDQEGKNFTFHIEASTYPNWTNTEQKRAFSIAADELTYTDPNASAGGRATVIWKRVK
jgi:hypothetical protein